MALVGDDLLARVDAVLQKSKMYQTGRTGLPSYPDSKEEDPGLKYSSAIGGLSSPQMQFKPYTMQVPPSRTAYDNVEQLKDVRGAGIPAAPLSGQNKSRILSAMTALLPKEGSAVNPYPRTTNVYPGVANSQTRIPVRETGGVRNPSSDKQIPRDAPIVDANLVSLASRYSTCLEQSSSLSYRQKVELEQLESSRNDLRMKVDILDKKLGGEAVRMVEREAALSKVMHERETLQESVRFIEAESYDMHTTVRDKLQELEHALYEVQHEREQERRIHQEVTTQIQEELTSVLSEMQSLFEEDSHALTADLRAEEEQVAACKYDIEDLKREFTHFKQRIADECKLVADETHRQETAFTQMQQEEVLMEVDAATRTYEDAKETENQLRKKLVLMNQKFEETKSSALKVVAQMKHTQTEHKNKLRAVMTEERATQEKLIKKETEYQALQDKIQAMALELDDKARKHQDQASDLVRAQQEEILKIEEHILKGKAHLDKVAQAIEEFKVENAGLRDKNEKAISNLRMGLDELVKGLGIPYVSLPTGQQHPESQSQLKESTKNN